MATAEKQVMVVGIDASEHSMNALEWTLDHFFVPLGASSLFKLVIVHAKPSPTSALGIGLAGPAGVAEAIQNADAGLKNIAVGVEDKAKELCYSKSVHDVTLEVHEGDPRNVLCEAVETHHATILVVGSHGHGAIKRAILGSVSDYCSHHAYCTVMIVKKSKVKH